MQKAKILACFFLLMLCTIACRQKIAAEQTIHKIVDSTRPTPIFVVNKPNPDTSDFAQKDDLYADYDIVIADTNLSYTQLKKQLFLLKGELNIPIDTLGRSFDPKKNLIALPADDEDEIYAGDYFLRRIPGENLSLEYLSYYKKNTTNKTIALVTGIYENSNSADSALLILKRIQPKAFKVKSHLYIGCMH